jgi:hypothetical protein
LKQESIDSGSDKMTAVLLKAGEVFRGKTGIYTLGKQLQETVWLAR